MDCNAGSEKKNMQPRRKIGFGLRTLLSLLIFAQTGHSQILELPPRLAHAMTGSEFAQSIANLDRFAREEKIYEQVALGNVPDFLRHLSRISVDTTLLGKTN
jgi:hypothetical protein